ncbi:MAG TPA: LemA family protein [bacterium]|nr:LemA family protein [bacterium]HOL46781.1 LemA family protein [bacterium]HPQ17736.1 LemA family protein [bacterium]
MIIFYFLSAIIILLIIYIIAIYNRIINLKVKAENSWAQIKVQLERRYDLIPNLVEAVKGYMAHERETLEKVIKARNIASESKTINEQITNDNILSGTLKTLFAVMENYPDLKANQNVMKLQEELTSTENRISFARQSYNDAVMRYNTEINLFPSNIIAKKFNFQELKFYEVDEKVSKTPEVKF